LVFFPLAFQNCLVMAQVWKVVGGSDKGGIIVREGQKLDSLLLPERVSTNALLEEVQLKGERLNYKLMEGTGPAEGWVSLKVSGKELLIKVNRPSPSAVPAVAAPLPVVSAVAEPLPVALCFPGQGSQYVTMLEGVNHLPGVQVMLEKAKIILGYDVLELCLKGPETKLEETRFCQPAMFIAGLAGIEKMKSDPELKEKAERTSIMAGLSLGEYTALCAAGVMSFEDGLKLVKLRGEAMQEAAGQSKQLMLSVAGLDQDKLEALCAEAATVGGVCSIANSLFPKGFSVGGTEAAIKHLEDSAMKNGAIQAKILKTSGAFHTSLMKPAQDKLVEALEEVLPSMKPPVCTVFMNASAKAVRPGADPEQEILPLMKKQLTSTVLWEDSVRAMINEEGITDFFEVGPMKQIKAMMKRIDPVPWKKMINVEV